MDYPVVHQGKTVGNCTLKDDGLYWLLDCTCDVLSDRIERLYAGQRRLGVLEREETCLCCHRRFSKASTPEVPPKNGVFGLEPTPTRIPWEGTLLGKPMSGFREGDLLLFPYDEEKPCPCEELICFFAVRDGFWQLPYKPQWEAPEAET